MRYIIAVRGRTDRSVSGEYDGGQTEDSARAEQAYWAALLWSGYVSICTADQDGRLVTTDLPLIDVDRPSHVRSRPIEVRNMPFAAEAASCC